MYPTRIVHHAAWDALDFLFTVGGYPRHLISLLIAISIMVIPLPIQACASPPLQHVLSRSNFIKVPIKIH